jgi:uncharacterized protein DUF6602
MSPWSLKQLFHGLHDDIEGRLATARAAFAHPTIKGDASQQVWSQLLATYLPGRYRVETAHVVDSRGTFSEQIDLVIFDRQYSPFVFHFEGQIILPSESVYAVFEAKQVINSGMVEYAQKKVASVRRLHRTSLPIPHAGGTFPAKAPSHIIGGVLVLESDWSPALGEPLLNALRGSTAEGHLDIGCIAARGTFSSTEDGDYTLKPGGKPTTAFLLDLIARLQSVGTVPMIDIGAYAEWLKE